ncbi:MAG: bifunctional helix-turn-helix transcriptional regulator/GNAT family N-acetyltransferase [Burkholderiaceae bacterium]|jgi:DNA-binding MarR family transcriptional regulator/N-acetylglutamate synthase-like GNAT family acetyltransferase
MMTQGIEERAKAVRHFNRFYTRQVGLLQEHLLDSEFSLTEARILYELAHRQSAKASDLVELLGLNPGYLSRVISGFEKSGFLQKTRSTADARVLELQLTAKGLACFERLDMASQIEVRGMLEKLDPAQQQELLDAMQRVEALLRHEHPPCVLRAPIPGDMGWIIHRHGSLYFQEYGWNAEFEALVAEIVVKFVREFDPARERCWVADQAGNIVGSVFLVRHDQTTAKLRLLYVEPRARGLGIGRQLVEECLRFAREAGYKRMILWTNSILSSARHIYVKANFQKIAEEPHHSFGKDLVGETWTRDL